MSGKDICGNVSQFLKAPKLSARKGPQLSALSAERIAADAKQHKSAHSLFFADAAVKDLGVLAAHGISSTGAGPTEDQI